MTLPTSITVREMRANLVYEQVIEHRQLVATVADIARLRQFASWAEPILAGAIDLLINDGRFAEGPSGRLVVCPRRTA